MDKQEFLQELRTSLNGLPQEDIEERLSFYAEMIDDRVEDGLTEREAVAAVGTVPDIVLQVVDDYSIPELVKVRLRSSGKMSTATKVLLIAGFPVWLPLLIAALAVVFSLWVSLWAVIASVWAVFAALVGGAVGGILGGVFFACTGYALPGLAVVGSALVCGGLSVFTFFGCKAVTKGAVWLTKRLGIGMKRCFVRKGEAQ